MDVDSVRDANRPQPRLRVTKRLEKFGVPNEYLGREFLGLVSFVADKRPHLLSLVTAIFPTDKEVKAVAKAVQFQKARSKNPASIFAFKECRLKNTAAIFGFQECLIWLQWLMFSRDPIAAFDDLSRLSAGRGVCGAVWGSDDIAYRCRTCEHDSSCAICVACFQNGSHKDHDYSIIHTGGGCCDCGDETAWKRDGFCAEHKGADQIQNLPQEYADSVGPIIDVLLEFWKNKFMVAQTSSHGNSRHCKSICSVYSQNLTFSIVEMLLKFCKCSERLLSFVARRVIALDGLLEVLVRSESSLVESVANKIHELLLKFLGEPTFKYEFAKVFIGYYPFVINEAIKDGTNGALHKYPSVSSFSVQIFTVPTLTPQLVKEMNLLDMLLRCLGDIFSHCTGDDGCLQASKWENLYETISHVVRDIQYVMSHDVVAKHVTYERGDILRTWMKLLSFIQGMSSLKRETGIHVEKDEDDPSLTFALGHQISSIHSLLVGGIFAGNEEANKDFFYKMDVPDVDEGDSKRYAKLGRLSQDSSASSTSVTASKHGDFALDSSFHTSIPSAVTWLAHDCLRAIENWLEAGNTSGSLMSQSTNSVAALRRTLSKTKRGKYVFALGSGESRDRHGADVEDTRATRLKRKGSPDSAGADDDSIEGYGTSEDALRILSLSEWPSIVFNVSSQHVSVHIYLHRLLALLLKRSLKRSYDESDVGNLTVFGVHAEFFGSVLPGYHPFGFSAFVMEHPLRSRVFCAQVLAGMWKKNGDAAIMSCEYYRLVRWSEEGLELDLFLLQCCAALAPADHYVSRMIERFGLSDYLSLTPYKSSEYEHILVQEMLTLIVQIVQERHFSGFTTAENLKRELVHRLAIGDATRSEVLMSLPHELSKSDKLQEILDAVALYSSPSGINQGMYSLRTSFWKELDLYHPRWSSRALQVAEERYMRCCNVSALTAQLPRWKKIYPPLQGVARVATCRSVLQVIRAVLFYAAFSDKIKDKRAPDGVLLAALHLLSLSLDVCCLQTQSKDAAFQSADSIPLIKLSVEVISGSLHHDTGEQSLLSLLVALMRRCKQENSKSSLEVESCDISSLIGDILRRFGEIDYGCMTLLQQLAPEVVSQLSQSMPLYDTNLSDLESEREKRKAEARERQAAIMAKMKVQQSKFLSSINFTIHDDSKSEPEGSNCDVEHDVENLPQDICSLCHDCESKDPLSFVALLQKSRVLSIVARGAPSWDKSWQSDKKHLSETEKVDQLPGHGEPGEVNTVCEVLKAQFPSLENAEVPCTSKDANDPNIYTIEMLENSLYLSIRNEMNNSVVGSKLGMENDHFEPVGGHLNDYSITDPVFLGKHVAALSTEVVKHLSASVSTPHNNDIEVESTSQPSAYGRFGPAGCDGIHLSSCGHTVHESCFDRYLSSLKERYIGSIHTEGGHIIDPDQGEFLCPVCRRLANSLLRSVQGNFQRGRTPIISPVSPSPLASPIILNGNAGVFLLNKGFCLMQSAANIILHRNIMRTVPTHENKRMGQNLDSFSQMLSKLYFPNRWMSFRSSGVNESMIIWDTLKYSLISMEISARSGNMSTRPTYSLDSLYKEFNSSSGFKLSMLLKIVQFMRSSNILHVLQRYRSIQLFGNSICLGAPKGHADNIKQRECDMLWKKLDKEILLLDDHFRNQATDPVLAHDAFSSFMWTLFCLPQPFFACEDSLLSLVHMFYAVAVVQAIITYCTKEGKMDDFDFSDSLITDIVSVVRESGWVRQYFVSSYIDCSSDIMVVIRRLSFPFLRKCALLWRLLRTSVSAQLSSRDERSSPPGNGLDMETDDFVELNEVEELEKMFVIPPLHVILKDPALRDLAMKWYRQFCVDYGTRSFRGTLHSTPAVPFRLMHLPRVYHDLLQRYIKQRCARCKIVLLEPALCLFCGRLCTANWDPCCREAGCETHANTCGAGMGVFLVIKRTTILLQRGARQASWPSPYLDAFGEEDKGMRRGRPLYLNEERYAALTHMMVSHDSRVLGQTTFGP